MAESTRKPGDGFPDVKRSRNAQATGTPLSDKLTPGATYNATIHARQGDGTYTVTTEDPVQEIHGVRLASAVIGGLLGFNIRSSLPPRTPVKMVYGSPSFIYAVLLPAVGDWEHARDRSILWGEPMDAAQGVTADLWSDQAEDLIEGEVEINNMFGISLQFLTTLIRMTAGDRAAVECHLINDMVRVISSQFRHVSGMGEDLIFDHGRPTMERGWSSYRHEVLGLLNKKDPVAELNGDEVDRDKLEERRVTGLGRMRFKEFFGFVGDFVHSFVTDPPETLVAMTQANAKSGAGKSWVHRNSDGSVIIQSVADIRIERVCRIPVPVRFANHEDPQTTRERIYEALNEDYLKLPAAISPIDNKDAYQAAYHIRSYARWLGRYHAFARMLQLNGEYKISSEADSPSPDWRNAEDDRKDANSRATYPPSTEDGEQTQYYDAYACISIMRDGSIVTHDGYGSSVVMSNGNVQVSAAKHIDLEAAGDIRMVAGGSILMKARRNIELSATIGGLIMHSYAWLKMLCEKGSVWLRSNAATDKDAPIPEAKEQGAPIPEVAGLTPGERHGAAILVEAAEGHAIYRSQMGVVVAVDGQPASEEDTRFSSVIATNGRLDLMGKMNVDLRSKAAVSVTSGSDIVMSAHAIIGKSDELIIGRNPDAPDLILRGRTLWGKRIYASDLLGGRITGPKRGFSIEIPDQNPTQSLKPHLNHIDAFPANSPPDIPTGLTDDQKRLVARASLLSVLPPGLPWYGDNDGPLWGFPEKEEYVWDNREKTDGGIPETLTQQFLRLDADVTPLDRWGGGGYKDWNMRTIISGKRIRASGGFGQHELLYRASDEGHNLHEPSAAAPEDFSDVKIEWNPSGNPQIKVLKRAGEP